MKLWPASLPQYAQRAGYSESPQLGRASFVPDEGLPLDRPKGTLAWSKIRCAFRMTADQLALFESFAIVDLKRGTAEFLMPHPRYRSQVAARLAGSNCWQVTPTAGNTWIVAVELMVKS